MRNVKTGNCLIKDKTFKSSIVDYNIMIRLLEDENSLIIQSGQDLLAIKSEESPTWIWIWVAPNVSINERKSLLNELAAYINENNIKSIWGYEEIVKDFINILAINNSEQFKLNSGMNAYYCPAVLINPFKYNLVNADIKFEDTISDIYLQSHEEMSAEKANSFASNIIRNGCVYLLKNGNEYVSMANITHVSMGYARINSVYTKFKYRSQGYATDLMAQLSQKLLDENLIPVLYTDVNNPISNWVYKKVGYINTGRIVNASSC